MIHLTGKSKQNYAFFLAMLAFVLGCNYALRRADLNLINPSTELYEAMIIAWGLTARRRIISGEIRHALMGGALLLVLLFIVRVSRYDLFMEASSRQLLLYSHYVIVAMIPVMSLIGANYVDRTTKEIPRRRFYLIWASYLALCVFILANNRHSCFIRFLTPEDASSINHAYTMEWGYFLYIAWIAALTLCSFFILLRRCALSRCRKLWYIPVIPVGIACALFAWYAAEGGSPTLNGVKLYLIQEVYALYFIGFWEGCILIGLIPTNTSYESLLDITSTGAVLLEGSVGPEEMEKAAGGLAARAGNEEDIRVRSHKVSGGMVMWAEDISVIRHLNDELEDAAQRIEEENVLLAEENRIRGEQAALEVQNRLYDRIAVILRPQMNGIETLLGGEKEDSFRLRVGMSAVLGAYAKRRANLEIISDQESILGSEDLYYSLKESSEYLEILGAGVRLNAEGSRRIPAEMAILAYEVFEEVVEQSLPGLSFLLIVLDVREGLSLRMVLSPCFQPVLPPKLLRKAEECSALIRVSGEDDELNVSFNADTGSVLSAWSPRGMARALSGTAGSSKEGAV